MQAERSWEWNSGCGARPEQDCRGTKTISLDDDGLVYRGFCCDVGFGGGYAIGGQTVGEFLTDGPLDEQVPAALVEEVRAACRDRA